eukprot:scpid84206/ scgid11166/ 
MDFSDSFFHDKFRADDSVIPERIRHDEPSVTSVSDLVPSGVSSSFDQMDSFFRDSLKADATISFPEPILKEEPSATSASDLVPTGISSAFFDQIEWPDSFRELEKDDAVVIDTSALSSLSSLRALAVDTAQATADESTPNTVRSALDAASDSAAAAGLLTRKSQSDFKSADDFKAYKMRREKNNEASRRSRTKFRQKAREMEEEVHGLREENTNLKKQLSTITAAFEALRRQQSEFTGIRSSSAQSGDTSL